MVIGASEVNGAFYGLQTLLQLFPAEIYADKLQKKVKWTAPCCIIEDEPEFAYRGFLFDCGRYFFPKEEVMKFIDLMAMHKRVPQKKFFQKSNFFEKLAGNGDLRKQIEAGISEEEIRATWKEGIDRFKTIRKKYLIYPDIP